MMEDILAQPGEARRWNSNFDIHWWESEIVNWDGLTAALTTNIVNYNPQIRVDEHGQGVLSVETYATDALQAEYLASREANLGRGAYVGSLFLSHTVTLLSEAARTGHLQLVGSSSHVRNPGRLVFATPSPSQATVLFFSSHPRIS